MTQKPAMLLILDGWGYRRPITADNAIEQGETPVWHQLVKDYPTCLVETSGLAVGLPEGQMGNSEVGHTNIGAGRVVMQDLPRIDVAIQDGSFDKNPVLQELISTAKNGSGVCHVMGLVSPGGVHSMQRHMVQLCKVLSENGILTARILADTKQARDALMTGLEQLRKAFEEKGLSVGDISVEVGTDDANERLERFFMESQRK